MARARVKQPQETRARVKQPQEISVQTVLNIPDDLPVYYVNYMEVAHSLNEFGLFAVRTPVKPSSQQVEEAQQTGQMRLEPEFHLVLPPTVIPGLIGALTAQKDAYEQARRHPSRREG
jgi:hypothetical protein